MDLRERILAAYDKGASTREEVARRFEVSLGMVKKLLQQRRRLQDIGPQYHRCGRKARITKAHQSQMRALLARQPDLTLAELREALGLDCTLPALNPIEKMWSKVKSHLRAEEARSPEELDSAIAAALEKVTATDALHWFASCGYNFI